MITEGDYLRGLVQRTADNRRARIVAAISSNEYSAVLLDTGGTVRVTAVRGMQTLAAGAIVLIAPIASAGIPNAGYVIQSVTSLLQPTSVPVSASLAAEIPTRIDSDPTTLVKGGAGVEVKIYGANLSTAPTYGDPGITDDVAQVITATLITLRPKASGGMAVGRYSLTAGGITFPNFFIVRA